MSVKTANILLLFLLLGTLVFIFVRVPVVEVKESVSVRDSIVRDTIRDTLFRSVSETVVRYDTIRINDTIYHFIPITRYEFSDTTYRFVVEGYNVRPLLIETYPVTHYITVERLTEVTRQKQLVHGFNAGVGAFYGTKGLDVGFYVGYGMILKF